MINFLAKARKSSILPTSLDIFDIRQHYTCTYSLYPCFTMIILHHKINPFPNMPLFLHICRTSLKKTLWEKEKLLSHRVFYPLDELFTIFIKFIIVTSKLFQIGRCLSLYVLNCNLMFFETG